MMMMVVVSLLMVLVVIAVTTSSCQSERNSRNRRETNLLVRPAEARTWRQTSDSVADEKHRRHTHIHLLATTHTRTHIRPGMRLANANKSFAAAKGDGGGVVVMYKRMWFEIGRTRKSAKSFLGLNKCSGSTMLLSTAKKRRQEKKKTISADKKKRNTNVKDWTRVGKEKEESRSREKGRWIEMCPICVCSSRKNSNEIESNDQPEVDWNRLIYNFDRKKFNLIDWKTMKSKTNGMNGWIKFLYDKRKSAQANVCVLQLTFRWQTTQTFLPWKEIAKGKPGWTFDLSIFRVEKWIENRIKNYQSIKMR